MLNVLFARSCWAVVILYLSCFIITPSSAQATNWQASGIDQSVAYWFDPTTKNFEAAKVFCEEHGGSILKITDQKVETYIRSKYLSAGGASSVWLNALQTVKNSKVFRWQDDGSIVYFTLGDSQNDYKSNDCVALSLYNGDNLWRDDICSVDLAVVCEKRLMLDFLNGTSLMEQFGQFANRQLTKLTNQLEENQLMLLTALKNNTEVIDASALKETEQMTVIGSYSKELIRLNSAFLEQGDISQAILTKLLQLANQTVISERPTVSTLESTQVQQAAIIKTLERQANEMAFELAFQKRQNAELTATHDTRLKRLEANLIKTG